MLASRLNLLGISVVLLTSVAAPAFAQAPGGDSTTRRFAAPHLPAPAPVSQAEYAARRSAIADAMSDDGVFVAFGEVGPELSFTPYDQNSPFRYLTGITEPGASLVMVREGSEVSEIIFVQPRNPDREIWDGTRLGAAGVAALTGMTGETDDRFLTVVDSLVGRFGVLYTPSPLLPDLSGSETLTRSQQIVRDIVMQNPGTRVVPLTAALQRIRGDKSPAELDLIRRAGLITAIAQREAMRSIEPGMNEFEIQALIEYVFRSSGANRPSFGTIVGSGPNATTLHYRSAERWMNAGELVVMDIGASYRGYAADITRTVPVNGSFSPEQREVYSIVRAAQAAAERLARVGATWADLDAASTRVLEEGLTRLGLIDGPGATYYCENPRTDNRCSQYRLFYMHALGHGVGLDVHDPDNASFGSFQVGSAFTLEPGIYVRSDVFDFLRDSPENREMVARLRPALERFAGIGVRIEDMYLMTEQGLERPSEAAPREIDEIEALMREDGIANELRRPDILEWYRSTTPQ